MLKVALANLKNQKRLIQVTFLLVLIIFPLYLFKINEGSSENTDFSVYHRMAERAKKQQWEEIYTLKDGICPYRYPPPIAPFFRPLAQLELKQSQLLWFVFQYFCFGAGFYLIYRSLQVCLGRTYPQTPLFLTCIGLLFILRFCLDTFIIGQVSAFMFFGFSLGLWGWVTRKPEWATLGIFIPAIFKIGPGILFWSFLSVFRKKENFRAFRALLGLTLSSVLLSILWYGPALSKKMWLAWIQIVQADATYFDAAHYGSQSLNSFLRRGVQFGWFSVHFTDWVYWILFGLSCGGTLLFWLLFRARSPYGRGLFFSLGIFNYLWFMPETFKYSLTSLAIPIVFIFAPIVVSTKKLTRSALSKHILALLGFAILTLPLAGKNVIGDFLFFGFQKYSLPLLSTLFLGGITLKLAYQNSVSSPTLQTLKLIAQSLKPRGQVWSSPPQMPRTLAVSLLVPIHLTRTLPAFTHSLEKKILNFQSFLHLHFSDQYEILFLTYGDRVSEFHPLLQQIRRLENPTTRVILLPQADGRGSALREGFLASRGQILFLSRMEQPCDVAFFQEALEKIQKGSELVRANRRHPESKFKIPVSLLPVVYGRHRLGLLFNRWVRFFLPVQTSDTHSGTLALTWRLAKTAFAVQTQPGFLFDLEMSLAAEAQDMLQTDLPVHLSLIEEKKFSLLIQEALVILSGVPLLAWRYYRGAYATCPPPTAITADDWGLSPGVNQGILELAQKGIVLRVSIMADGRYLTTGLKELCQLKNVKLGLHFNLTHESSTQRTRSPGQIFLAWLNPFVDRTSLQTSVRYELCQQLEKLKKIGIQVQYLDGHHHIHLVPGLIDAVSDLLQKEKISEVRLPYDRSLLFTRQAPIAWLALLAQPMWRKHGLKALPCVYPQKNTLLDPGKLRILLAKNSQSEVIVHPAAINDIALLQIPDTYTDARVFEYQALKMLEWL